MAGCSAAGRRPRSNMTCSPPSITTPGSARTKPASRGCRRSTRAASPPRQSRRQARGSATRARPTRTGSSAAVNLRAAVARPARRHERPRIRRQTPPRPRRITERDHETPRYTNRPSGTMTGGRALAEMLRLVGRRADVRHGRVPTAAVLRRGRPGRPEPPPDQRRALRRLCRRRLCAGHQPPRHLRRHARPRRHQPRHRPRRDR